MIDLSRALVAERKSDEAVALAEKAIQAGADHPSDLAALAEAQISMSNWVLDRAAAKDGVAWAERAVTNAEVASRKEPANPKLCLQLATAYDNLAVHYGNRDQQDSALSTAKRAVEAARQAVAIDPENPSNRMELARKQGSLARLSSNGGTLAEYRALLEEAKLSYREQIARAPRTLQHRLDFANWLVRQLDTEFQAANYREVVPGYEEALRAVRDAVAGQPSDRIARRLLNVYLLGIGEAYANLREHSKAQAAYQEALAGERSLQGRNPGAHDLWALAYAEAKMALGLTLMGERSAALEHYQAASATLGRGGNVFKTDRQLIGHYGYVQDRLTLHCINLGNGTCARAAIRELSSTLNASYQDNPYDTVIVNALWNNLSYQRTDHARSGQRDALLEASRRSVEIAKKWAAALPEEAARQTLVIRSMVNWTGDLMQAGMRAEALAANREFAAWTGEGPIALLARMDERPAFGATELAIRRFDELEEPGDGFRFGIRLIPALESAVQRDPDNQRAADNLIRLLFDTASNGIHAGLLMESRDLTTREVALRLRRAPRTSDEFHVLAQRQLRNAYINERLGAAAAAPALAAARESLRASYATSDRALHELQQESPSELANMQAVRSLEAFVAEQDNRGDDALRAAVDAVHLADRLFAARNSFADRNLTRSTRARVFRLLEMRGAADREFQAHSGSSAPLSGVVKAQLIAEGWKQAVEQMFNYPCDPARRVLVAERAVIAYRALPNQEGTARYRTDLAVVLRELSFARELAARGKQRPAEQAVEYEKVRAEAQESLDILQDLRDAGKLITPDLPAWVASKIRLAAVQSRLAGRSDMAVRR
jgi:tetratricopeptide (TPR) repeat protein